MMLRVMSARRAALRPALTKPVRSFNPLFDSGDPGFGDDVAIFRHLVLQERSGFVELEPDRYGTDLLKAGLYRGVFRRRFQCGVQSLQVVPRDISRSTKPDPAVERVLRQPRLRRRRC